MHAIVRSATYDYTDLKPRFFAIMDTLGGDKISPDARVLIKPNLLSPARPGQAVLTHPLIIRAAVEYVLARRGIPLVADSPAIGSFEKILRDNGIKEALSGLKVTCQPFAASVPVDIGPPFGAIELAREAVEAEVTINLPKLKTHSQMLLTLGVKNMFGCVVGYRKPEWHLRAGVDRDLFARLLVLIARRLRPSFTILDGILAMEGEGPGSSGVPRRIGVLIGATDPLAVDLAVCLMLNLPPPAVPTLQVAAAMGLLDGGLTVDGQWPEVHDFAFPALEGLLYGPESWQHLIRRYFLPRPVPETDLCKLCNECLKICPAKAIGKTGKELHFHYERCIRCYCCLEVCPWGAIRKKYPPLARAFRTIAGRIL